MVGNVIVKCELFLNSIFQFLRPQKIMYFIRGGHFEFHIVVNVIGKSK